MSFFQTISTARTVYTTRIYGAHAQARPRTLAHCHKSWNTLRSRFIISSVPTRASRPASRRGPLHVLALRLSALSVSLLLSHLLCCT